MANEATWMTYAATSPGLQLHDMPHQTHLKTGQRGPKSMYFGCKEPQTKNGSYLGLCGSKSDSKGTHSLDDTPPLRIAQTDAKTPCSTAR